MVLPDGFRDYTDERVRGSVLKKNEID